MRNVELSTLCLVLISACVDFHKVKRGLPVKQIIAIKGGGRPTRLFTSCQNAAYSNKVVFICWVDYALEGSAFILSKCDFSRMFHTERS